MDDICHLDVICTSSAGGNIVRNIVCRWVCHLHIIYRHICHPHIICRTPQGQHGPKLYFCCDRNWLLNGICRNNDELFHFRIMKLICDIICVDGFLCMSHVDIVHMLSAYVHVIYILSGHICIMCTLFAVVLDIFLPNRQCRCHPYVISSTLYISYHIKLSFCTLSTQTYIVNAIWMLSAHVHIICLSFLTLLINPIIHNLLFCTLSPHTHIVYVISILSTNAYIMHISFLLLLFTYVHVIRISSENIRIMCTLCAVVLDMFLPNRQCC